MNTIIGFVIAYGLTLIILLLKNCFSDGLTLHERDYWNERCGSGKSIIHKHLDEEIEKLLKNKL